jgi:DNA (cytosine-5)-methyltransferase 1
VSVAYYNENDRQAAAWLRELIRRGHIAPGMVDERSIEDVSPADLDGYTQCHFFAGIGGWSCALRMGGWPDGRAVWTASLPCQPFSAAGARVGFADERHLWPVFFHLLTHGKHRTVPVLGEQVANRGGLEWFDLVSIDLENAGYAVGATDTCAAGFGASHLRQRLYWLADADEGKRGRLADSERRDRDRQAPGRDEGNGEPEPCRDTGGVADADRRGREEQRQQAEARPLQPDRYGADGHRPGPVNGHWAAADWIFCRDGKWRAVEPGTQPLAHGIATAMASVFSIQERAWTEIAAYADICETNPDKILRMVRDHVRQTQDRQEQPTGVRVELHASEVLLDFLFSLETTRDGAANGGSGKKAQQAIIDRAVRSLRRDGGVVHTPRQRRPNGQPSSEPSTALRELSFILARHAAAYSEAALDAHAASNRVAQLRGYGNSLCVPQAAAFVRACSDLVCETETT